jgi:hypothetical protein
MTLMTAHPALSLNGDRFVVKLPAHGEGLPGKEISFILCPLAPPTRRGLRGTFRSQKPVPNKTEEAEGWKSSIFQKHRLAIPKRPHSNTLESDRLFRQRRELRHSLMGEREACGGIHVIWLARDQRSPGLSSARRSSGPLSGGRSQPSLLS